MTEQLAQREPKDCLRDFAERMKRCQSSAPSR